MPWRHEYGASSPAPMSTSSIRVLAGHGNRVVAPSSETDSVAARPRATSLSSKGLEVAVKRARAERPGRGSRSSTAPGRHPVQDPVRGVPVRRPLDCDGRPVPGMRRTRQRVAPATEPVRIPNEPQPPPRPIRHRVYLPPVPFRGGKYTRSARQPRPTLASARFAAPGRGSPARSAVPALTATSASALATRVACREPMHRHTLRRPGRQGVARACLLRGRSVLGVGGGQCGLDVGQRAAQLHHLQRF